MGGCCALYLARLSTDKHSNADNELAVQKLLPALLITVLNRFSAKIMDANGRNEKINPLRINYAIFSFKQKQNFKGPVLPALFLIC